MEILARHVTDVVEVEPPARSLIRHVTDPWHTTLLGHPGDSADAEIAGADHGAVAEHARGPFVERTSHELGARGVIARGGSPAAVCGADVGVVEAPSPLENVRSRRAQDPARIARISPRALAAGSSGHHQPDVRVVAHLAPQPEGVECRERLDGPVAAVCLRVLHTSVVACGDRG